MECGATVLSWWVRSEQKKNAALLLFNRHHWVLQLNIFIRLLRAHIEIASCATILFHLCIIIQLITGVKKNACMCNWTRIKIMFQHSFKSQIINPLIWYLPILQISLIDSPIIIRDSIWKPDQRIFDSRHCLKNVYYWTQHNVLKLKRHWSTCMYYACKG